MAAIRLTPGSERFACRYLEHIRNAVASFRRALGVSVSAQSPRQLVAVVGRKWLFVVSVGSESQIGLCGDEDDRCVGTEMTYFRHPLVDDVVVAVATVDGDAYDDNVRALIADWTQSVVVLLAGRVPQH